MFKYREERQGKADLTAGGVTHGRERKATDESEIGGRLDFAQSQLLLK